MSTEALQYASHVNADSFVREWIQNVLAKEKNVTTEEYEHIIDFFVSKAAPKRISKMSFEQAKKSAQNWTKSLQKKGAHIQENENDIETILDFNDGFRIVKLVGENAYKREGFLMRHCVGSYFGNGKEIYSLRDGNNMPHCTMEKDQQIKGKGNGDLHQKYVNYIIAFLEKMGMTVGDNEMAHLGYYPYNLEFISLAENFYKTKIEPITINKKKYLRYGEPKNNA